MNKLHYLLLCCTLSTTALADTASNGLYKVTVINKPRCIEFYHYKSALYCSTIAFTRKPIDRDIINYEKFDIVFDEQAWLAARGNKEDFSYAVQYIPKGDTLENWHEMVTSQFIPRVQAQLQPIQYFNRIMEGITNAGFQPTLTVIEETPDEVTAEFQVSAPEKNVNQDEIMRIIKTDNGFYVLHYATHNGDMGANTRKKWIANLKKSKIINPYE